MLNKPVKGYAIDPQSGVFMLNLDEFVADITLTGEIGYETFQEFDGNRITKYRSVVITGSTEERIQEVENIYGIKYSAKTTFNNEIYLTFVFVSSMQKGRYHKVGELLSKLYQGQYGVYTIFERNATSFEDRNIRITDLAIFELFEFQLIADSVNEPEEIIFNYKSIEDVAQRLKYEGTVDPVLNIAPRVGEPFNLAVHVIGDIGGAMRWANSHLESKFILEDTDIGKYIIDGVKIKGPGVLESSGGYSMETQKGVTRITDFTISVHYLLIKADGEKVYIVTLTPLRGKRVEHIEWKNISSDSGVADYLMKLGPFHLKGGKNAVQQLHEMISSANIPTIYTYHQYGMAEYKGSKIMICDDAVYDMDTRRMFPRNERLGFYFLGGNDGIVVDLMSEKNTIEKSSVPKINRVESYKYDDYLTIAQSLYANKSADVLCMFACSMAGVALYHEGNKTPSYYITGVTGTGKSSFAEFLQTMFGIDGAYGLKNSTAYPLKIMISAFNKLPVFLNEFRSDMKYASEKLGYIQMAYDNSTTSKGLRNGGLLSYKMSSQVFCEGEDTYDEGSIRTRSILHTLTKSGTRVGVIPKIVIHEHGRTLRTFFGTYAHNTCKQDYDEALRRSQTMFYRKGVEPRISDNISIMYAGCCAFDRPRADYFKDICLQLIEEQMDDFKENSEGQKIIGVLAQYYGSRFCNVYLDQGHLIINWVDIREYIERLNKKLTLSVNAYKGHLESLGFEKGSYEISVVDEWAKKKMMLITGFRMPIVDLPKDLMHNSVIYSAYRAILNSSK